MFFGLLCPGEVSAVTQSLSTDNVPLNIDQSQEFDVNVNFSCPSCSTDSYLRGVFYPSGTSYFGYTEDNNGNWSNAAGGNCTTYFKVAQADLSHEGTWSGTLKVKLDTASTYYAGPGEYLFKVGRYTPSCSSASVWSTEATIAVTGPTPTPTASPTNTSTPTPAPANTPTLKPTVTPKPTQKPTIAFSKNLMATNSEVLGDSSESAEPTEKPQKTEVLSSKSHNFLPIILILVGLIFLIACVAVFFYPYIAKFINEKRNK